MVASPVSHGVVRTATRLAKRHHFSCIRIIENIAGKLAQGTNTVLRQQSPRGAYFYFRRLDRHLSISPKAITSKDCYFAVDPRNFHDKMTCLISFCFTF